MKNIQSFLAASVLLMICSGANASVITYHFAMTVEHMFEYDGATQVITNVSESMLPGVRFANGDRVEGSFSYPSDMALTSYQPDVQATGSYRIYGGDATSNLKFLTTGWTYTSNTDPWQSTLQVANDASTFNGHDIYSFSTAAAYSPINFDMMTLNLYDDTGKAFDSDAIPSALSLSDFSYNDLDYGWLRQSDGSQMHTSGRLTSLSIQVDPSVVPISPTIPLLFIGFGALLLARRRTT